MGALDFTIRQYNLRTNSLIFKCSCALSPENVKFNLVDDDSEFALDDPRSNHVPHVRL